MAFLGITKAFTSRSSSIYQPLPNNQSTRLLQFLPCRDDRLLLRLIVVDLKTFKLFKWLSKLSSIIESSSEAQFDALSYTWGAPVSGAKHEAAYDSTQDVDIIIKTDDIEHTIRIGRNLYEALLQVRATMKSTQIWVDAICINQADWQEKSTHILFMEQIYARAQRVIVWMGKDVFGDFNHINWLHTTVVDRIEAHVATKGALSRSHFGPFNGTKGVTIFPMARFLLPDEALQALYRFYGTRRYISRAWIVQEVALAKESIVLLEHYQFPFRNMFLLAKHFNDLGGMNVKYIHIWKPVPATGTEVGLLGRSSEQIANWKSNEVVKFLRLLHGAHDDRTMYLAYLEYLLGGGAQRLSSDPRDQIYCLLGMANWVMNIRDLVKPDYTATVDAVFTQFTTLLLTSLPHRTILSHVTDRPAHADYVQRLPSWVPDFATNSAVKTPMQIVVIPLSEGKVIFNACADGPKTLRVGGNVLHLYARKCAAINFSFQLPRPDAKPGMELARGIFPWIGLIGAFIQMQWTGLSRLYIPLLRVLSYGEYGVNDNDYFCTLWRRLLALTIVENRRNYSDNAEVLAACQELEDAFAELPGYSFIPTRAYVRQEDEIHNALLRYTAATANTKFALLGEYVLGLSQVCPGYSQELHDLVFRNPVAAIRKQHAPAVDRYTAYATRRLEYRYTGQDTFFVTDKGNAGRIRSVVQPGDELWLICHAKVPFVLRPCGDKYKLVGEAYVQDGMQGELLRNDMSEAPREIEII